MLTCLRAHTHNTSLPQVPEAEAGRLDNVRLIITGGEACTKELVNRWAQTPGRQPPGRPRRRFFNTYGPTEVRIGRGQVEGLDISLPL